MGGGESMAPSAADIAKIFKAFDTSGDGLISAHELQAALTKGGKSVSDEQCIEILHQVNAKVNSAHRDALHEHTVTPPFAPGWG